MPPGPVALVERELPPSPLTFPFPALDDPLNGILHAWISTGLVKSRSTQRTTRCVDDCALESPCVGFHGLDIDLLPQSWSAPLNEGAPCNLGHLRP